MKTKIPQDGMKEFKCRSKDELIVAWAYVTLKYGLQNELIDAYSTPKTIIVGKAYADTVSKALADARRAIKANKIDPLKTTGPIRHLTKRQASNMARRDARDSLSLFEWAIGVYEEEFKTASSSRKKTLQRWINEAKSHLVSK